MIQNYHITCKLRMAVLAILAILSYLSLCANNEYELRYEKLMVNPTERNFVVGDTIRILGQIIDASADSILSNFSKYVYFELISPDGTVERRIKLLVNNGTFSGSVPLNYDIAEGLYTLCGYTTFMRNWSSEFFFKRPLLIASPYTKDYHIDATIYDNALYLSLKDRLTKSTVKSADIKVTGNGKTLASASNKNRIVYKLNGDSPTIVKVSFDNYSKYLNLPTIDEQLYNLNIYPEGGRILVSYENMFGIHVTDVLNRGIAVDGHLIDSDGVKIVDIKTNKDGFGEFKFTPEDNEQYYIVVGNKKVCLPKAENNIAKLTLNTSDQERVFVNAIGKLHPAMILSIEHNGNVLYLDYVQNDAIVIDNKSLPQGLVNFKLLSSQNELISQRFFLNIGDNFDIESLAQEIGTVLNDARNIPDTPNPDIAWNALSLCMESSRYDLNNFTGEFPIEIGGEILGNVKTERGNKPIKNASVDIIVPSLGTAYSTKTDENGCFEITGLDWPDNTAFVCMAKDSKGNILPNITLIEDSLPEIEPLPDYLTITQTDAFYSVAQRDIHTRNLQEIQVVARAPQSNEEMIASVLGIKSLDEESIEARNITNYEEAIRMFPGIFISSGKVLSRRGGSTIFGKGGAEVEFWIDGMKWEQTVAEKGELPDLSSERKELQTEIKDATINRKAKVMTGGLIPINIARQLYNDMQSTINEISACYPFSIVKSISYVPPQSALYLSNTAAHKGGAIVIITKNGQGNTKDIAKGLKVFRPIGYQF